MKYIFFSFILLLQSMSVTFASYVSPSEENFKSRWNYTPLVVKKEGSSEVHTKIFKRYFWIDNKPVTLADTTFIFVKNPADNEAEKNSLSSIAENVKRSFGPAIKIKNNSNEVIISGEVSKLNRVLKMQLRKTKDSVVIITTMMRAGFAEKINGEVDELHQTLIQYKGETEVKISWHETFRKLFLKDAYAAEGLKLGNLINGFSNNTSSTGVGSGSGLAFNLNADFSGLTNSLNSLDAQASGINTNLGTANTNWGGTNVQLGNANNNWNGTNTQLNNANTNWNNTNAEIKAGNKNWSETNKQMAAANVTAEKFAKEMNGMNTNWAETNKILASALDPGHMGKLAFYSAAGAALGGVAVNLAIQGVSEGISFLHELFTGAKKKKLEWSDFEKAMDVWDTKLNDLVKLEQIVDSYLAAFDYFDGKHIGNDYVKQLEMAMTDMSFDRETFMEKFKDQNSDMACRKLYFVAAQELDKKIKDYEKIVQFASKNSLSITDGPQYFCSQLKELQRRILAAETQMQDLRLKILVAENQYYDKQNETLEKRDDDIEKINKRLGDTLEEKKAFDKKITERMEEAKEKGKIEFIDACMDGKNPEGQKIKSDLADTFFLFVHFKKRTACDQAYAAQAEEINKRSTASLRTLAAEEEMRRDLLLKANHSVELKLSEEQMSWLSRLHLDAHCYQYAHGPEEKIPAKCKEFPETLHSLGLARGYEKAREAYQNKCQERYLNGLKKLSENLH